MTFQSCSTGEQESQGRYHRETFFSVQMPHSQASVLHIQMIFCMCTPSADLQPWVESTHWEFPPEFVTVGTDINELEMWPVLSSVLRWGYRWRNKRVVLYTDNNQVLYAINDNKSRNNKVMGWLREIFWSSFVYNFYLTAARIPSAENVLPDCLSRISNVNPRSLGLRLLKAGHFDFRSVAKPYGGSELSQIEMVSRVLVEDQEITVEALS